MSCRGKIHLSSISSKHHPKSHLRKVLRGLSKPFESPNSRKLGPEHCAKNPSVCLMLVDGLPLSKKAILYNRKEKRNQRLWYQILRPTIWVTNAEAALYTSTSEACFIQKDAQHLPGPRSMQISGLVSSNACKWSGLLCFKGVIYPPFWVDVRYHLRLLRRNLFSKRFDRYSARTGT